MNSTDTKNEVFLHSKYTIFVSAESKKYLDYLKGVKDSNGLNTLNTYYSGEIKYY